MTPPSVDGHWLDFYALLGVPVSADEDAIRKRIGKVYSEAAANSDHRDLTRRHYFQALLERVLPQCRRVLLDPEWRAKYDQQHALNAQGDPSAQHYIAFITSMRGQGRNPGTEDADTLPQRVQEDINLAREVVECAWQGAQLELLPSKAVSSRDTAFAPVESPKKTEVAPVSPRPTHVEPVVTPQTAPVSPQRAMTETKAPAAPVAPPVIAPQTQPVPVSASAASDQAPVMSKTPAVKPIVDEIVQSGESFRAQVITGEEAAALRRERAISAARETLQNNQVVAQARTLPATKPNAPMSRIVVGDGMQRPSGSAISSTSLHLLVAIVGVLLTITVQHFSNTPAVADTSGRTPIILAVAPEMQGALNRAEAIWEKTPEGSRFDVVVQPTDSRTGLGRALGSSNVPDVWIPSDTSWVERYNRRAPKLKRQIIGSEEALAQSPMVLIARTERTGELRRLFPRHQITSWQALRGAVMRQAAGHLGLSDPQRTESGALARVSMAREWGTSNGMSATSATKSSAFWSWMAGFEDNSPSASARTADMVKDMAQGTTGRFWWVVAYESDALQWMRAGKKLEIFYLPRTTFANHPFCPLERVGASSEVAAGRAALEKFLRSPASQKALLGDGFRPTEVNLKTKTADNPFLNAEFRARGARIDGLPLEERANTAATEIVAQQWSKRYG